MRVFLHTFNHCEGGKGLYTQHPDDDLLLAKVGCQSDKSPDDALFFLKNSLHQSVRSTLNESPQINNRIALHFQVATQKFDLCCPPFNVVKKNGRPNCFSKLHEKWAEQKILVNHTDKIYQQKIHWPTFCATTSWCFMVHDK